MIRDYRDAPRGPGVNVIGIEKCPNTMPTVSAGWMASPCTHGWRNDTVIEQATASDFAGKVLITIRTTGDLNGTVYYWGTPRLEGEGSMLSIPDLQMASESKTMLDTIKVGYWQQVDQALRNKVQTAARVDLSDRIAQMQSAITGTHASGEVTTVMTMARQQPQRAYSTPAASWARAIDSAIVSSLMHCASKNRSVIAAA